MVAVGGNGGEAAGAADAGEDGEVCASARLQVMIVPRTRAPQAPKALREDDVSDFMFSP
jgi:hypothetical protein